MDRVTLYQFAFSHYNEKVRWALDLKDVPHARRSLMPGFHAALAKKLSGATQTPILTIGSEAVAGSASILERLEKLVPSPRLFPEADDARIKVAEWVAWFDDEVGPATRLALFHEMFDDPSTAKHVFTAGQPVWKRVPYGWMVPRMAPMLRERMDINADTAREADTTIRSALDRVAEAVSDTGYLVGGEFTAADLTGAALLFPLTFPKELPFDMPSPASATMANWKGRWSGHPAVEWMESIFRQHRQSESN